jgi:hypothetical protein
MHAAENNDDALYSRTPTVPVSAEIKERSRKNEALILNRLAAAGQVHAAAAIGVHESTINKMKEKGDFERTALFLAFLGLKVVPIEMKCYDPVQMDAIFALAKSRLNTMESASQLSFED